MSFPHKCGQLNWYIALNVEVMVIFPDISLFHRLHDSDVFLSASFSGARNQIGSPKVRLLLK